VLDKLRGIVYLEPMTKAELLSRRNAKLALARADQAPLPRKASK
jgi:hypothetical protein